MATLRVVSVPFQDTIVARSDHLPLDMHRMVPLGVREGLKTRLWIAGRRAECPLNRDGHCLEHRRRRISPESLLQAAHDGVTEPSQEMVRS